MNLFIRRLDLGGPGPAVAIKDTIDMAGLPTTAGSRALADAPPARENAEVVERLLRAQYRIVGKTTLHELAFGMTGANDWAGTPLNPRYPGFIVGGSSSGSAAAVAAGLCDVALGTDTGGSIRVPAACCGVWGLKPTWGRVSRRGAWPRHSSLDCIGPFAADVDSLAACMRAITADFDDGELADISTARIGLLEVAARDDIQSSVGDVVHASGFAVRPAILAHFDEAYAAAMTIIQVETYQAFGHLLSSAALGADVEQRLRAAAKVEASAVAEAEKVRARFTQAVDAALAHTPILALPTLADAPPRVGQPVDAGVLARLSSLVRPFNLSGHPALTLPLPGSEPRALQLIAGKGQEELLFAVAKRFASLTI